MHGGHTAVGSAASLFSYSPKVSNPDAASSLFGLGGRCKLIRGPGAGK